MRTKVHTRLALLVVAALVAALAAVVGTAGPAAAATYQPPTTRERVSLNDSWKFTRSNVSGAQNPGFDDSGWSSVTVPHTWNATDGADGGSYYRGVGWYRRHYTVPSAYAGRRLVLQFAGANAVADVYVNGTYLGQHRGGYSRFRFDATDALRVGQDNVIAVKVDNGSKSDVAPQSADYTFFGGIYRNVSLHAVDPLMVRMFEDAGPGLYLTPRSVGSASAGLGIRTKVWNNSATSRSVSVRAIVTDASGTVVKDLSSGSRSIGARAGLEVDLDTTISSPRLWKGRTDPYLYRVTSEVRDAATGRLTDSVTEPLGFRTVTVDDDEGLRLNGGLLKARGVNLHQDRLGKGWAISDADAEQNFSIIREMGANSIRLAHYQHDQKTYELADQQGFLLWTEIPVVNNITSGAAFQANAEQQMRELVTQNYNHPAVAFWGIANEVMLRSGPDPNPLMRTLASTTRATEDKLGGGRRATAIAHCCASDTDHPTLTHTDVVGYNKYFGWYTGSYNDFGKWADDVRAAQPERRISVSEYGAGASINQHQENPPRPQPDGAFHPEEYQALYHEAHWKAIAARPFIWGSYVWNMFDFASDGRDEGDAAGRNDKGLVTYDRATRKDAFYWYKVNWASTPTTWITSRRWTNRTDATVDVKVYSNASSVTLTVNGTPLTAKTSTDRRFIWPVTLRSGTNTIRAVGTFGGGSTVTDTVTWTLS